MFARLFVPYTDLHHCKVLYASNAFIVPADEGLGRVLTGLACDSLPHGRRSPSNVLFRGPSCHFDSMRRPTLTKVFTNSGCLETLQATEGGPGRVLATACPVAEYRYGYFK